jgi:predicted transcriptional regulator
MELQPAIYLLTVACKVESKKTVLALLDAIMELYEEEEQDSIFSETMAALDEDEKAALSKCFEEFEVTELSYEAVVEMLTEAGFTASLNEGKLTITEDALQHLQEVYGEVHFDDDVEII